MPSHRPNVHAFAFHQTNAQGGELGLQRSVRRATAAPATAPNPQTPVTIQSLLNTKASGGSNPSGTKYAENPTKIVPRPGGPTTWPATTARPKFVAEEQACATNP